MDKRVFIILIGLIVLIGAILGIRSMLGETCEPPEISYDPSSPETGQVIKFTCINADEKITWIFSDGSTSSGKITEHKFDSAGTFTVKTTVGDDCNSTKEIIVRSPRKVEKVQLSFSHPTEIFANQLVTFSDQTPEASNWKWKVLETGDSSSGMSFNYTFKKAQKYNVQLTVSGQYINGDTTFLVEAFKPKPVPVTKPKPDKDKLMTDAVFKEKFMSIANDLHLKETNKLDSGKPNPSNEWKDSILNQFSSGQSLIVDLTDDSNDKELIKAEDFKRRMLTGRYTILQVIGLERGKNKFVVRVTIKVKSNTGK